MRTTLTIDDDLFAAVRNLAQARQVSIGMALSELIRKALADESKPVLHSGFPVFDVERGSRPITLDDVRRGEDEA